MKIKSPIKGISSSAKTATLIVLLAKLLVLSIGSAVSIGVYSAISPAAFSNDLLHRWDSNNYEELAKVGNANTGESAILIVFFPLYPLLIRALTFDLTYINLSALIVANVASLIGFLYLYKLAMLEFDEKVALKAVLFLSVFPMAYFFSVPYTEGLFFALAISAIYYARLSKWPLAGLLGFLCSLTRLTGLLLLPALLIEYYHQTGWRPKATRRDVVFVFSAFAGFLIYLCINQVVTGNALTFIAVENVQWHNTLDPWLGLNKAWFWVWDKPMLDSLTIGIAPIAFAFFGLVMIGVALWKRMRSVYVAYMFLAWSLAISTSWWISVPRYIMAMFPMFMLLGSLTDRKAVNAAIVVFSIVWLCIFTVFFAIGWWAF